MTMIANCRAKFTKDAYPSGGTRFRRADEIPEDEINPYWEGNLKGDSVEDIKGYDWAVYEVAHFFEEDIDEIADEYLGSYTASKIDGDVLSDEQDIDNYTYGEIRGMSRETYLLKLVYSKLRDVLEMARNEHITTCIEEQDEEE